MIVFHPTKYDSAKRPAPPQVAVTNRRLCPNGDLPAQIARIAALPAASRPSAILLREKDLTGEEYLALARRVMPLCAHGGILLIAHHFTQEAKELGIPALHLPFAEFTAQARAGALDAFTRLGVSIHSPAEAREAETLGADTLICGNIFATPSKPGLPPKGLEYLRECCEAVSIPVYAIGGINGCTADKNAALCMAQGAAGVCAMGWWMRAGQSV